MKQCRACKKNHPATKEFFHAAKSSKDGLNCYCKPCAKGKTLKWLRDNRERKKVSDKEYAERNKEKISQYQSSYRKLRKDERAEYHRKYREKNKDALKNSRREYSARPEVKERRRIKQAERRRRDRRYALSCNMRSAISERLRGRKRGAIRHVDWSIEELYIHIEKQFTKGMGWDNYGDWHIDHIVPESKFSYQSPDDPEFLACWSLSNLRPLWSHDNCSKQDKITHII